MNLTDQKLIRMTYKFGISGY